jgi:hypothetical protein
MARKISTRWFDSKDEEEGTSTTEDDTPKHSKVELKLRYPSLPFSLVGNVY